MKRTGVALVAVLSMMLVVSAVVFGMTWSTQFTHWIMRNDTTSTGANYIALAGLQRYKTVLLQNYKTNYSSTTIGTSTNGCLSAPTSFLDLDRSTAGAQSTMTESLNGGSVTVSIARDSAYPNLVVLTSTGSYGGATSRVRSVLNLTNAGLFSYAYVGGTGSSQMINGNATISGGIFVEGNLNDTTNSNTVLTLGGSVSISDSYSMSNSNPLYNYVTPTSVGNLCSSVRVAHGKIVFQNSATSIGSTSNPVNAIQVGSASGNNTNALIYRNNSNSPLTPQNCSAGMCAVNIGRYDLPISNAPHLYNLDLQSGEAGFTCNGSTNQSWRQCLNNDPIGDSKTLLLVQGGSLPTKKLFGTNTTLTKPSTSTCNLASSNSNPLNNNSNTITLSADIDCVYRNGSSPVLGFKFTNSNRHLEVYGTVVFQGLDFSPSSGNSITYRASAYNTSKLGAGSLVFEHKCSTTNSNLSCGGSGNSSKGLVTLNGDLLPDKDWPSSNAGKFPFQTLTIIADGNSSSTDALTVQSDAAAILYSAQRLHLTGGNNVGGVLLADSLCVGNNCSGGGSTNIYYIDPTTNVSLPTALAPLPNPAVASVQILSSERY